MRSRSALLILLVSVCGSLPAGAQMWPQPQPPLDPTAHTAPLGSLLEQRFTDLLTGCVTDKVLHKMKLGPGGKYTAIPQSLQSLPPGQPTVFSDQSIARIFTYIYTGSEANNRTLDGGALGQYVEVDALKDQASMQFPGFNIGLYQETCGSTLQSALHAKAGISLPSEGFSSALDAQFNSGASTVLTLGYSTFRSPLASMLQAHDQQNLFANLLFWMWYGNNSVHAADTDLTFISQFKGISIVKTVSSQSDVKAGANGSANASFTLASLEANMAATASQSNSGNTTSFTTAIYKDSSWQYSKVPTPASIIAAVGNVPPRPVAKSDLVLRSGTAATLTVDVDGVPPQMCNNNALAWQAVRTVDSAAGQFGVPAASVPTGADPSRSTCEFTVSFLPDDSVFAAPTSASVAPIRYRITHTLAGTAPAQVLAFAPVSISANTSAAPSLGVDSGNDATFKSSTVKQPPNPDQQTAMWAEKINYDDGGDAIVSAAAPLNTAQITCGAEANPVSVAFTIEAAPKTVIDMAITRNFPSGGRDLTVWDTCTLAGTLTLKTASGRTVSRNFPAMPVYFPRLAATPPAQVGRVAATVASGAINLSWPAVSVTSPVTYTVYRGAQTGTEVLLHAGLAASTFSDTGLTDGTAYFYQVTATAAGVEGQRSSEVTATPHN